VRAARGPAAGGSAGVARKGKRAGCRASDGRACAAEVATRAMKSGVVSGPEAGVRAGTEPGGTPVEATGGMPRVGSAQRGCARPTLGAHVVVWGRHPKTVVRGDEPIAKQNAINAHVKAEGLSPTWRANQGSGEARGRDTNDGMGTTLRKEKEHP